MFTGDRSGDVLYAALYRAGLASQPVSASIDDGMRLTDVRITAPVHCAPPDNTPTPAERNRCAPFLGRNSSCSAPTLRVVIVLGAFGWQALLATLGRVGVDDSAAAARFRPRRRGGPARPDGRELRLLGCYHVSQQNTFTGRLTPLMLDKVIAGALAHRNHRDDRDANDAR